jgi:hypothetical protein
MKLHLHIGTFKTGTSTLQRFLLHNAKPLSKRGLAVPSILGEDLMPIKLASAIGNPRAVNFFKEKKLIPTYSTTPSIKAILEDLEKTFSGRHEQHSVLSWEGLPHFFYEQEELQHLKALLGSVCDEIQVIVYLRRQDSLAASLYGEVLYQGRFYCDPDQIFSYAGFEDSFSVGQEGSVLQRFDYARLLRPWAEVFGKENIIVRPFERQQLLKGDVVTDFFSILGCQENDLERTPDMNQSMDRFQMEFLRHMIRHVPTSIGDTLNESFLCLGKTLHHTVPRTTRHNVPTAGAEAFLARFADSNAEVAREYLGREDGVLFREPAAADNSAELPDLTVDKAVELAANVWNIQWANSKGQESLARTAASKARFLQDCNTALYAQALSTAGRQNDAAGVLATIPDLEQRHDIRDHLFQTYAIQDAAALDRYNAITMDTLRIEHAIEARRDLPRRELITRLARPKRLLVFRSAPAYPCADLFATLFQAWPDVTADIVIQDGCAVDDGHSFAERLEVAAAPFTAEAFHTRHRHEALAGRYDLAIVPTNGDLTGYREFIAAASALGCGLCATYRSDNLALPAADKYLEFL